MKLIEHIQNADKMAVGRGIVSFPGNPEKVSCSVLWVKDSEERDVATFYFWGPCQKEDLAIMKEQFSLHFLIEELDEANKQDP
jgi:hypothetical protein